MTLELSLSVAGDIAVAGLAGLAVGIEREWSGHASGPGARFAGARTMLLLGILGGLAGWIIAGGLVAIGAIILLTAGTLTVAAYIMASRSGGPAVEGTTEVAALVVLALGTVAGLGFPLLTSAAAAVIVLALIEKTRIHGAIARLGERELAAALEFAVLALVILPILPEGPYGPFDAIRPRMLWTSVLLFSGLNFAGYIARRAVGETRGYSLTGLLGGTISSTAVSLQFSRKSREEPGLSRALGIGVIGACTVLLPRCFLVSTALNPTVGWALVPYILPALVLGAGVLAAAFLRKSTDTTRGAPAKGDHSPLGLWSSIQLVLGFQLVLFAVPWIHQHFGATGVLASAAVLGFTDMDALTFSMAKLGTTGPLAALGAHAIAIGILSNTVLKLALTLIFGVPKFRRIASTGLVALGLAAILGLWIGAR